MDQEEIPDRINKIDEEIRIIKTQVESKLPWYRNASTIVAILALAFSFGTTIVSYSKAKDQEYIASRIELRSIMKRLSELPVEHTEMLDKYKNEPTIAAQLSGQLNAENLSLSNQADAIIARIEGTEAGKGKILDVEYITVANALSLSFQHEKARKLMQEGYNRARDATTAAGALRSLASIALYFNEIELARNYMKEARSIYEKLEYKNDPVINKKVTNATTEIQWANMEYLLSNCENSKSHLESGLKLIQFIPPSSIRGQLESQAFELEQKLTGCS